MEYVTLNNGVRMPKLGFGTYQIAPGRTEACVAAALACGYRSVDTAQNYGNEAGVGAAVHASGIPRNEIFVTTKTQTSGYAATARGIDGSLRQLGMEYVDLLIIHWPAGDVCETYRALEDAYADGKARAIGLSNFYGSDLRRVLGECDVAPAVDQIECHPFWQQRMMRPELARAGVQLMDWSPLACGRKGIFANPVLAGVGAAHGKTAAQVALRFLTQEGDVVAAKTENAARAAENLASLDFELAEDELARIRALDEGRGLFGWPASGRVAEYDPA